MAASYETALSDGARSYLLGRGISEAQLAYYRVGQVDNSHAEHADYAGMLCFPYVTKLGGIVSLKFRQAHDCTEACTHAKYISPYETRIYNALAFDQADQLGYIAIAEGEIDAITLDFCGIPAVGIPGVETWKQHAEWRELFRGYERVYVFPDNDPDRVVIVQGKEVVKNPGKDLAKAINRDVDTARIITLPGKDVNDTFLAYGADSIRKAAGLDV